MKWSEQKGCCCYLVTAGLGNIVGLATKVDNDLQRFLFNSYYRCVLELPVGRYQKVVFFVLV